LIGFLRAPNRGFGLRRTERGVIPRWRSCARAIACEAALISPLVWRPFLSVPLQMNNSLVAVVAIAKNRSPALLDATPRGVSQS
jgi:hypothetical protein